MALSLIYTMICIETIVLILYWLSPKIALHPEFHQETDSNTIEGECLI